MIMINFQFMKSSALIALVAAIGLTGGAIYYWQSRPLPEPTTSAVHVPVPALSPEALAQLQTQAAAGQPAAQTRLADLYLNGNGVKASAKTAVEWLQKAVAQNYPDAQAKLGELTQAGQGVTLNLTEAARLYRLAAEQGNVAGAYDLAYLYEQGSGVNQDQTEAAKWYERAAIGGDPLAQYDLGQRYELGVGVATNRVAAFKWLTLAAAQGQADSGRLLDRIRSEMSSEELAKAAQLVAQAQASPAVAPVSARTNP